MSPTRLELSTTLANPATGVAVVAALLGEELTVAGRPITVHQLTAPSQVRAPYAVVEAVLPPVLVAASPMGGDTHAEHVVQVSLVSQSALAAVGLHASATALLVGLGHGGVPLRPDPPGPVPASGEPGAPGVLILAREATDGVAPSVAAGIAQSSLRVRLVLALAS